MDANHPALFDSAVVRVSIHAPVMDANEDNDAQVPHKGFNPRARDGRENIK